MSHDTIDATYSPEDNKLRLYSVHRLDDEVYARAKKAGFRCAPKQDLFVAPSWTPSREDLCIELAGEVTAEQTTLVERAENKADRLDNLAIKRAGQSNAFYTAAQNLSRRFEAGQPILRGHHSERSARRDKDKMDSAMRKSIDALNAVSYWNRRAEGVEHHANRKANPGVRERRIKVLLKDLRDVQREINHAEICITLWEKIDTQQDAEKKKALVESYVGCQLKTGSTSPWGYYSDLNDGKMTHQQVIDGCLKNSDLVIASPNRARWISHILNRLAYERSELWDVTPFTGNLTATILQAFTREHGTHSPKAIKKDDQWTVTSATPLPLHLANAKALALSSSEWVNLMQSSGYEVPAEKPKQASILNFRAESIMGTMYVKPYNFIQIEMTKAEYSRIYKEHRGVRVSPCGGFRFKICKDPEVKGYAAGWVAVYLTDSKTHPAPDSTSIKHKEVAA